MYQQHVFVGLRTQRSMNNSDLLMGVIGFRHLRTRSTTDNPSDLRDLATQLTAMVGRARGTMIRSTDLENRELDQKEDDRPVCIPHMG